MIVSGDGMMRYAGAFPVGRRVVVLKPLRVNTVFQRRTRSIVPKQAAIPQAAQRRCFIKARAFACFGCQAGVGSHRLGMDFKMSEVAFRDVKVIHRGQQLATVVFAAMAARTVLFLEDHLTACDLLRVDLFELRIR